MVAQRCTLWRSHSTPTSQAVGHIGFWSPCNARASSDHGYEYKTEGVSCIAGSICIQTMAASSLPVCPCGTPALCSKLLFSSRANTTNVNQWQAQAPHWVSVLLFTVGPCRIFNFNFQLISIQLTIVSSPRNRIFRDTGLLATFCRVLSAREGWEIQSVRT